MEVKSVSPLVYVGLWPEYQRMSRIQVTTKDSDYIIMAVCIALRIDRTQLFSKVRKKRLTDARSICCWYMRELGMKLVDIGRVFDRDHSTVIHSLKKFEDLNETDREFQQKVYKVKNFLRN